jgi:hypothetical protein
MEPMAPRFPGDRVPLTFSQRWTWRIRDLDASHSTRSVAVATRLVGPLNTVLLRESFSAIVRRHESLRTRLVIVDGVPVQHIDDASDHPLPIIDLTRLAAAERENEASRLVNALVHEPIQVAVGPLFATRLVQLGEREHVLCIALDHIVSDAASLGILLRDLWTTYGHLVRGEPVSFPEMPVQFADFSVWQAKCHSWWLEKHGGYWRERLSNARRFRFFAEPDKTEPPVVRMTRLPICLSETVSAGLRERSRQERTSPAMLALTAYFALLLRWFDANDMVITLISMGRYHPRIKHTIGYFGHALHLRASLSGDDRFSDLLRRVIDDYARALAHADAGYVAAQSPMPEFATNPRFNWIPQDFGIQPTGPVDTGPDSSLQLEQRRFDITPRYDFDVRGGAPELLLSDTKEISGVIWYRADLAPPGVMERFAEDYVQLVERMVDNPRERLFEVASSVA